MRMPCIHVGRAGRLGPVTYFPLWSDAPVGLAVSTGEESAVVVEEIPDGPLVGTLVVTNPSETAVLLVGGELLEGGWQHRALQHDFVLAPGERSTVDVCCVEQGRWHGQTVAAHRSRRAAPRVQTAMTTADADQRQSAVWEQVATYDESIGVSPTTSFVDYIRLHESRAGEDIGPHTVKPLPGQCGVAFGAGGYPIGLELFATEGALAAHLEQILAAVLLDASTCPGEAEEVPGRRVRRLVGRIGEVESHHDDTASGGIGRLLRADTDKLIVRGITLDDTWAHLSVYDRRHPLVRA